MIELSRLPWWRRALLSWGGKKRNKRLLDRLSGWNLTLAGRNEILAALNLNDSHLILLSKLAGLSDGRHPYESRPTVNDDGLERLTELGLVILAWPGKKISLSDAGRFLLSLTVTN